MAIQRRRNALSRILRLLCGALLATMIAGCADTPKSKRIPWWPQGPGNATEEAQARAAMDKVSL